jgi:hypothetical protein
LGSLSPLPWLLFAWLAGFLGCGRQAELGTVYGQRHGAGTRSVNGTLVLAERFDQAGFRVSGWRRLSPKLERERVIVWAPDRFSAPRDEEIDYFENWLQADEGRTLVLVGRDYDAAIDYWQRVLKQASGAQRLRARQQLAQAQAAYQARRHAERDDNTCSWFAWDFDVLPERLTSVEGPLISDADSLAVDLPNSCQLTLHEGTHDDEWAGNLRSEALLSGDGRLLAARLRREFWPDSQIIVVVDGSWLLNLPQVDRAKRQLASRLIEACGPPNRVCFLESGPEPLTITSSDTELPLVLQMFQIWPVNLLMLHLVAVGLIYCFHVCPIFGRPRRLPEERLSDFGKHISAVGELLERGQDYAYAKAQLDQYQDLTSSRRPRGEQPWASGGPTTTESPRAAAADSSVPQSIKQQT